MRKLPPLTALRSFEAAARHLSFKAAAEELFVTPGAMSLQIRKLEEHVGTPLFRRFNRRVELTDAGFKYLARVKGMFDELEEATRDIVNQGEGDVITVSAPPMFLQAWLMPRLQRFQAGCPELKLRFLDTLRQVDFQQESVDASIWYGMGDWEGIQADQLFEEALCPICSPQLLKHRGLDRPEDLPGFPLIYTERRVHQWDSYLAAGGYGHIEAKGQLFFLNSIHTIQAVKCGLGVALANRRFIESDVREGSLIIPFELDVSLSRKPGYYFVAPERQLKRPPVQLLRQWLSQQSRRPAN